MLDGYTSRRRIWAGGLVAAGAAGVLLVAPTLSSGAEADVVAEVTAELKVQVDQALAPVVGKLPRVAGPDTGSGDQGGSTPAPASPSPDKGGSSPGQSGGGTPVQSTAPASETGTAPAVYNPGESSPASGDGPGSGSRTTPASASDAGGNSSHGSSHDTSSSGSGSLALTGSDLVRIGFAAALLLLIGLSLNDVALRMQRRATA